MAIKINLKRAVTLFENDDCTLDDVKEVMSSSTQDEKDALLLKMISNLKDSYDDAPMTEGVGLYDE